MDRFWQCVHQYGVLAFYGDMGAGKTTFIHKLCDYLGVQDSVSSPTFALINEYRVDYGGVRNTILHMDWYRLKDTEEAISAGMEEALQREDAWCFVEWADRAEDLLPTNHIRIEIELINNEERLMNVYRIG